MNNHCQQCQIKTVKQDLPNWLFEELENGSFGKDYLIELNQKLIQEII